MRGNGKDAWFGRPTSAQLGQLRDARFDAPDLASQQQHCKDLQTQNRVDVPFISLGQFFQPNAYRKSITRILKGGLDPFHNVRRPPAFLTQPRHAAAIAGAASEKISQRTPVSR